MPSFDFKVATPDTSAVSSAFLFGADSQSAADPSIYAVSTIFGAYNLHADASNVLALRNSTNAQSSYVYNTFTDASNYERGAVGAWLGNVFEVGTQAVGSGTLRNLKLTGSYINSNATMVYGPAFLNVGSGAAASFAVSTGQWAPFTWEGYIRLQHTKTSAYVGGETDGFNDESTIDVQTGGTGNYYSANFEPLIKSTDTKTRTAIGVFGGPKNNSPTVTALFGLNFAPNNTAACSGLVFSGLSCSATNSGAVSSLTIKGLFVECANSAASITAPEAWGADIRFAFSGSGSTYTKGGVLRLRDSTGAANFLQCTTNDGNTVYAKIDSAGKGFFAGLDITDAKDIVLGTTTGTKIGTATTQKLGFYNAAPVVQPNGTGETTGFTAGVGTAVNDDSTFTGNVGSTAYRINDIVKALKNIGLLAT